MLGPKKLKRAILEQLNSYVVQSPYVDRIIIGNGTVQAHAGNSGVARSVNANNVVVDIVVCTVIGAACAFLIYRNWGFLASLFRETVETAVLHQPQQNIELADRIFRVAQNNPDVWRSIYEILRRH